MHAENPATSKGPPPDDDSGPPDGGDDGKADLDPRILEVKMIGGERRRDFRSLGHDVEEVAFETWPLSGPRTAMWVLMFLLRRGVAPIDHHCWWLSTCRLTASDWGTSEHYSCCWILELMGSFDQLDLPNIAAVEAVARRLQAIEWQYRERVRETSRSHVVASVGVAGVPALTTGEVDLFEGAATTNATLMVCPLLIRYVSDESKTEADVSKAARKAR